MPSQQYEPSDSDASASAPDQQQPDQPAPQQELPTQDAPTPTREQPAQSSLPRETAPGTQRQPAYGVDGAGQSTDGGQGWSRPEDRSSRNVDNESSSYDSAGYDSSGRGSSSYEPASYDAAGRDATGYEPTSYDADRYDADQAAAAALPPDSDAVRAREKEAFGGVKLGAAFFGWLTAVGASVILVTILAAVASALDLSTTVDGVTTSQNPSSLGIGKIIAGLGILFVAYYVGGYVAGRMARFNGARQGLAVWLWAVLIAAILTLVGVLFESNSDLARNVSLPDFRIDVDTLTVETLIAVGIVLAVTLIGAIIGGLAGMRFHRRVDRAGFAPDPY